MAETSTQTKVKERLWGGYSGKMLAVVFLGTMANQATQFVLPPLLPFIIEDLAITTAQAGLALSVLGGLVAIGQYPGGRLSDILTHKTVIVGSLALMFVGLGVVSGAIDFPSLLVGILILGMGAGLYQTASFAQLAELYVVRRGQAFGINAGAFDLGGAIAAGIAVGALAVATWRAAFVPLLVALLAVLVLFHRISTQRYVVARPQLDLLPTARRLVVGSQVRRTLVAFSLYMFVWQGSMNFLPAFLQAEKSFSPVFAGNVFAAVLLVGVVTKPAAGVLGDRFGEATVAVLMPALCALGIGLFITTDSTVAIVGGVLVYAVGLAAYFPLMSTHLINLLPSESQGGDFGAARTIFFGVGSLGPAFVGSMADSVGFSDAFWAFVGCLLACAAVTAMLDRSPAA